MKNSIRVALVVAGGAAMTVAATISAWAVNGI